MILVACDVVGCTETAEQEYGLGAPAGWSTIHNIDSPVGRHLCPRHVLPSLKLARVPMGGVGLEMLPPSRVAFIPGAIPPRPAPITPEEIAELCREHGIGDEMRRHMMPHTGDAENGPPKTPVNPDENAPEK